MSPDILSVSIRVLSFVLLFQAAGMAIFIAIFRPALTASFGIIRRFTYFSAFAAIVFVLAHYALEAPRMTGEMSSIFDVDLQRAVFTSASGHAFILRIAGLLMIVIGISFARPLSVILSAVGTVVIAAAFALIGHTSVHPQHLWLAVALAVHIVIVSFWFGALAPLYLVSMKEGITNAAVIVDRFSVIAVWLVPGIALAGLIMAVILVPQWVLLKTSYGELLLAKIVGFLTLMGLAALNKWRLGPALLRSDGVASKSLRRSLVGEYILISGVLGATAIMTSFFSPEM